eukprot:Amastigsp_a508493_631.p3 type:complete len:128 gc:universal Amastigsp_a508493_631:702-319(-)
MSNRATTRSSMASRPQHGALSRTVFRAAPSTRTKTNRTVATGSCRAGSSHTRPSTTRSRSFHPRRRRRSRGAKPASHGSPTWRRSSGILRPQQSAPALRRPSTSQTRTLLFGCAPRGCPRSASSTAS